MKHIKEVMKISKHPLYNFIPRKWRWPFINDFKSRTYYYFAKKDKKIGRRAGGTEKRDLAEASGPATPLPVKSAPANHPIA